MATIWFLRITSIPVRMGQDQHYRTVTHRQLQRLIHFIPIGHSLSKYQTGTNGIALGMGNAGSSLLKIKLFRIALRHDVSLFWLIRIGLGEDVVEAFFKGRMRIVVGLFDRLGNFSRNLFLHGFDASSSLSRMPCFFRRSA